MINCQVHSCARTSFFDFSFRRWVLNPTSKLVCCKMRWRIQKIIRNLLFLVLWSWVAASPWSISTLTVNQRWTHQHRLIKINHWHSIEVHQPALSLLYLLNKIMLSAPTARAVIRRAIVGGSRPLRGSTSLLSTMISSPSFSDSSYCCRFTAFPSCCKWRDEVPSMMTTATSCRYYGSSGWTAMPVKTIDVSSRCWK